MRLLNISTAYTDKTDYYYLFIYASAPPICKPERKVMKIICSREELMKSINIVAKAVPVRTTMPVMECFLIDASAGKIRITANDMEMGIETTLEGITEEKGIIAINARMFSEIVRKLPDSDIIIETDTNFMTTISCGKAVFKIAGMEGDDFSRVPFVEKDEAVVMSQFLLKEMIRQTIFSISQNDTNKIMTGELMDINKDEIRLISLDGHRISIRRSILENPSVSRKVIIPGKTLSEISKILSGNMDDMVEICMTKNLIMFSFEETVVVSRLIDGDYFNVDQMISRDYESKVTFNRREMIDCIDRSLLFVREEDKKPIILYIEDGSIRITIQSRLGSFDEDIFANKEGKDVKIAFNPKFMMDALRAIDDENVDIYLVNGRTPCVIRDEAESFVYLVLPVNFV